MSYYVLLKICHDPDEASTGRKSHHKAKIQAKVFPHLSQLFKDLGSLPPTTLNRGPARGWTSPTANELWKSLYSSSRLMVKQATSKRRSGRTGKFGSQQSQRQFPVRIRLIFFLRPTGRQLVLFALPDQAQSMHEPDSPEHDGHGAIAGTRRWEPLKDDTKDDTRRPRGKEEEATAGKASSSSSEGKGAAHHRDREGACCHGGSRPLDDTPADGDDAMVLDEPFPPPHMGLALRPKRTTALAVENLTLRSPRIGTLPSGGDSSPATQRQQRNNGPTTKAFVGQQQQRQRQHSGNGVGKRTTTSGPAVARLKKDGARLRAGAMAPWEMSPVLAGGVRLETIR
ncbi:hypothetical protein B0T17DRAFT_544252 [Bombardia bombarda]|uniref:Uncharacterized protein n=1 Tax=Bombardia bombarda TaxID=252184 RepID=A0AA39WCG5_9PEZI|nr:hypothetical protein B0T17DRAFT_544252 [Bombardia bombarda]